MYGGCDLAVGAALALLGAPAAATRAGSTADRGLELAAGREAHRLLCRDLDSLTGADVGACASRPLATPERAEARQCHVLAFGNLFPDRAERSVEDLGHLTAAVTLRIRGDIIDQAS